MNDKPVVGNFKIPRAIATLGILIGGSAAIGVPWVALTYGGALGMGGVVAAILSALGIFAGVGLVLLCIVLDRK
jgi:hypothetical protein